MSDNINSIIAQPIGINPVASMAQYQALKQAQQQTALTQQQVQGAGLANQLSALQLSRTGWLYGLAGVPGASGGGAAQSAPAALPGAGGAGVSSGGGGTYLPPAQTDGSPGQAAAASAPVDYSGRLGQERLGVALPPILAASVLTAQNSTAELKTAVETRRQALYSSLNVPPSQFPAAVDSALRAGWITPAQAQMADSNPGIQQQLLSSFATPEAHLSAATSLSGQGMRQDASTGEIVADPNAIGAAGQKTGATSTAENQSRLNFARPIASATALGSASGETAPTYQQIGPPLKPGGPRTWVPVLVNKATLAESTGGGAGSSMGGLVQNQDGTPAPTFNGGLASAGATGPTVVGQSIWNNPNNPLAGDIPQGRAAAAPPASYLPPTAPSGVVAPAAANALPQPAQTAAGSPAAANALPQMPPVSPAAATMPQPAMGGVVSGPPILTPPEAAQLEVQKAGQQAQNAATIGQMKDYQTAQTSAAAAATSSNALVDQMRVAGQGFAHGSFADTFAGLQKTFGSIGQIFGGKIDPSVSSWEEFNKDAGQLAQAASSKLSPQVGVGELQLVQKYLPSATMSSQAFGRIADQIQGLNDFQLAKNQAASVATGSPSQFESQFNRSVTPAAFIVHRMSADDAATFAQALNKTEQGRATLKRIIGGMNYASQNGLFPPAGSN